MGEFERGLFVYCRVEFSLKMDRFRRVPSVNVNEMEPADRDPVKLRNTAIKLVLFMIFGGLVINWAYRRYEGHTPDRPSYRHAVRKNLQVVTEGGDDSGFLRTHGESLVDLLRDQRSSRRVKGQRGGIGLAE